MPKIFGFPTGLSTFKVNLRLEPICRSGSKLTGISARIADPMWLLARQWQMGEFLGEDAGSPVSVEVTYSTQPVGRLRHGDEATLEPIDRPSPIEVLVEKEASPLDWRLRVQIWQQLERAIWATLKNEAPAIIELLKNNNIFKIALPAPDDEAWLDIDPETESYLRFMQNRALDGGAILQNINKLPEKLIKGAKEEDGPINIVNKWCKKLNISISPPPKPKSWRTAQMDYKFTLNDGKTALIAPSYRNGNLDWYSFNVGKSTINPNPWPAPKTERKLATRIAVRGTSPRWWAFEDGSMNLGKMELNETDLPKMLLLDYLLLFSDDWFSIPLTVPIPSLVKIDGIWVKNVFGENIKIEAAETFGREPLARWQVFALTPNDANAYDKPLLFVPPACGFREESDPLEEVRFMRDEMANMTWAVEQTVRNGLGKPSPGFELQRDYWERRRKYDIRVIERKIESIRNNLGSSLILPGAKKAMENQMQALQLDLDQLNKVKSAFPMDKLPQYRLATYVPQNWVPFIPRKVNKGMRLIRAQMLNNTDTENPSAIPAMSHLLEINADALLSLHEATVPRAGLRYQLTAQRVRWADGKTYAWLGRKVLTGMGEGSSGLQFDSISQPK